MHHFMYEDVLFDYFKDSEPEVVEESTGPDPSDLDWVAPSGQTSVPNA